VRHLVERLIDRRDLTETQSRELLIALTEEDLDEIIAAAALIALRTKGETADELRGFALGLRDLAIRPEIPEDVRAVDVVGTGGDGSGSLNLSTGSALVAAAAGVPIIKHGNRSISSQSGSADVLAALGLDVPLGPRDAGTLFERIGFTFLFAPAYHPAMKSIAPVRRSLAVRTLFNLAGPLANPATPPFHVIGAYSLEMAGIMAETLAGMPSERAFVVHGSPGWDEVTPAGPYHLFDVRPGSVDETVEDPLDSGIDRCSPSDLIGRDAEHNAQRIRNVFEGEQGPHRDALILGASLALRVVGHDPEEALRRAAAAIDDGKAASVAQGLSEKAHV
jgi:anthranilate phosphoribosyltransferase